MKSRKEKILNIKKIKKQVKGITLIALVVTIIVLLILAGVALNLTIGQNGIFTRAQDAANTWKNAEANEQLALEEGADIINSYLNGGSTGGDQTGTTVVDDVPIPDRFYYVGGTKESGLVISDAKADENKYKGQTEVPKDGLIGNQFVWVPVEDDYNFKTYCGYYDGEFDSEYFADCEEPYSGAASWETDEYNAMKSSVERNNGFYVARYEASQKDGKLVSQAGNLPCNNIPWGVSMTDIGTEGAVYQAQKMYNDDEHAVTSTLIYGCQWDAIMSFIDPNYKNEDGTCNSFVSNSDGQGYYNADSPTNCGYYQIKNIYDLAGNVYEWTMEAYSSDSRVNRGGPYRALGSVTPASYRNGYRPGTTGGSFGFRVALYL